MSDLQTRVAPDQPITPRQLRYLQAVARESGYDSAGLDNRAQQEFQRNANQLTRSEASTLIGLIDAERRRWRF